MLWQDEEEHRADADHDRATDKQVPFHVVQAGRNTSFLAKMVSKAWWTGWLPLKRRSVFMSSLNLHRGYSLLFVNEGQLETPATILHADLDAFYASVEQLLYPSLRGQPIAVGGEGVLAASN